MTFQNFMKQQINSGTCTRKLIGETPFFTSQGMPKPLKIKENLCKTIYRFSGVSFEKIVKFGIRFSQISQISQIKSIETCGVALVFFDFHGFSHLSKYEKNKKTQAKPYFFISQGLSKPLKNKKTLRKTICFDL